MPRFVAAGPVTLLAAADVYRRVRHPVARAAILLLFAVLQLVFLFAWFRGGGVFGCDVFGDPTPWIATRIYSRPRRPGALFVGFLLVGLCGFGGVLPWARRMVVEQRRWMSATDFTDLLALCQFLPGPNVINVSVALGQRFFGLSGAIAAFVGLMAAPMVVVILLGLIYTRFADVPAVRHLFVGLAAAASGLVLATSLKIAAPPSQQCRRHRAGGPFVRGGCGAAPAAAAHLAGARAGQHRHRLVRRPAMSASDLASLAGIYGELSLLARRRGQHDPARRCSGRSCTCMAG